MSKSASNLRIDAVQDSDGPEGFSDVPLQIAELDIDPLVGFPVDGGYVEHDLTIHPLTVSIVGRGPPTRLGSIPTSLKFTLPSPTFRVPPATPARSR